MKIPESATIGRKYWYNYITFIYSSTRKNSVKEIYTKNFALFFLSFDTNIVVSIGLIRFMLLLFKP